MTAQVLLFCNSCGTIFGKVTVQEIHYEETCPFCGAHGKVAWRKKPFTANLPSTKNMVIPELQRLIVATPSSSRLGFLLKLRFGEAMAIVP